MEEKRKNIYDDAVEVARRTMVLFLLLIHREAWKGPKSEL